MSFTQLEPPLPVMIEGKGNGYATHTAFMAGQLKLDELVTTRYALEDINKGFELMHSGESIRSVVLY